MAIKKRKIEGPDLFSTPLEPSASNFSVKKEIETIIANHGGLVIDDIGLNEAQSKKNLGEKFNQIILGVSNNDPIYEEYFSAKEAIAKYLWVKFPYAKSSVLVFEILYGGNNGDEKISLCFDTYGKLDYSKMSSLYKDSEIRTFFNKITSGNNEYQKYNIRKDEIITYLEGDWYDTTTKATISNKHTAKKQLKEERRLLDNTFPIPKQVPGLPYIYTENNLLAIKYMVGLHTATEIKDVLKNIDDQVAPYNLPWLKTMLNTTLKEFRAHSYIFLPSSLSMDDDVIKVRERKGRLTMRLKNLIDERKIPDIAYDDGMITYTPTGVAYDKDFLFNFRPHEWKQELLRWIEKSSTIPTSKYPPIYEEENIKNPGYGLSPNTNFYNEKEIIPITKDVVSMKADTENTLQDTLLNQTDILTTICKKHPEIFFGSNGKFDLARMKTEHNFTTAMDTLERILRKRYPYNNEYLATNTYLYTIMNDLLDTWKNKETIEKVVEGEALLIAFFDDITQCLSQHNAYETLHTEGLDGVEFWLTATIGAMDFIGDNETLNRGESHRTVFNDRFDRWFVDENLNDPREIKQIVWDIVKKYNQQDAELLKNIPNLIDMFRAYKMRKNPENPALWLQRRTIRENLLDVDIPEYMKNYTSDKTPQSMGYFPMREFIKHSEQYHVSIALNMVAEYGVQNIMSNITSIINRLNEENNSLMNPLFAMAGLTKKIEDIEKEDVNIKTFFSLIRSSIMQFGYGDIIDNETVSDEYRDRLHTLFDMILDGLQRYINQDTHYEEDFTPRFIQHYGENNPYKDILWKIINLKINHKEQVDFAKFLLDLQHLVPMFASFLANKEKDGILTSFKKNALTEYFKRIAPKRKVQNFRMKDKKNINFLSQKIDKKNALIRESQQKEYAEILNAVIKNNHIQGITVSVESLELRHPATRTKINLPFIYGKDESELLHIVQNFLDNEVATAFLSQEPEIIPEITPKIIEEIRATLEEIGNDGIILLPDEQLLQYKNETISLGEIAIEGTYKVNIMIRISEIDGTMDTIAENINTQQKDIATNFLDETVSEENIPDTNNGGNNDDDDLPF